MFSPLVLFFYYCAEKLPVEAKLPWYKQAQELEETAAVSEEPS